MDNIKPKPSHECAVMSVTVGNAICDALNLDSKRVQNIDIRIHAGDVVNVYVQMTPTISQIGEICRVLKHYTLHDEDRFSDIDVTALGSDSREYRRIVE